MSDPYPDEDPYVKEKRFAAIFGGFLLLVLLVCLVLLWAASP